MKTSLKQTLVFALFAMTISMILSCGEVKRKIAQRAQLKATKKELAELKKQLPMNIEGTSIMITDVELQNDIVAYTAQVDKETWEAIAINTEIANSDRNFARVLSNIGQEAVKTFISSGLGIKYIYLSAETQEVLEEVEMSPDKLREVNAKMKKGEIEAYTLIELSQMELDKMELPSQIEEDIWITDAYIKGHDIYYEATFDYEIDAANVSFADLNDLKKELIDGLKDDQIITLHKKEMFQENIHFIYIYKDSRGKEWARVSISPAELFKGERQ